ncbi:MAG: hypothetical protein F9B45_14270 [Phycisphaera sp. RhM]|nr:hypothetical protein [Phycisphaera sp. RhM]
MTAASGALLLRRPAPNGRPPRDGFVVTIRPDERAPYMSANRRHVDSKPRRKRGLTATGRGDVTSRRPSRRRVFEVLERRLLLAIGVDNLSVGAGVSTYKLALATTVEFTEQACTVSTTCNPQSATQTEQRNVASDALDQIVAEVNAIFQRELAIKLELIPDNDLLISTGSTSFDGYSDSDTNSLLIENGPEIEDRLTISGSSTTGVGARNEYDLGHVLAVGAGGGLATLGAVGQSGKAQGVSGVSSPLTLGSNSVVTVTDSMLGILLHELGHQFGAEHSFNGASGNCSQRAIESSYEPGSGSTIMAYQGICGSDNLPVEPGDERYFHAGSFDEIQRFISTTIPTLRPPVANGNTIPTIDAGPDVTIPAGTPFVLTADASDPDSGDSLTYTWEQIDVGSPSSGQTVPIPDANDAVGPLFRSFAPTAAPDRIFPRLSDILANTSPLTNRGEHLPTQSRVMNFRATVRDNHNASGATISGVRSDDVRVTVVDTGAAFAITSPNTSVTWSGGSSETVTWAVAGTDANGINTATIQLSLSLDGGNTFPILLGNYPNNGSASIVVPNLDASTSQARIRAKGVGNVFFDISDQDFSVSANASAAGVTIVETGSGTALRETPSIVTDSYQIALDAAPSGGADVTITVTADAQSEISLTGAAGSFAGTQTLVFNNTTPQNVFVRAIDDLAVEGTHASTISHAITATDDATNYPLSLAVASVAADIIDNDTALPASGSGQLVGIDFDPIAGSSPTNWTRVDVGSNPPSFVLNDLIDEAGNATTIDLLFDDNTGSGTSTPSSSTLPSHTPSLAGIDGLLYSGPFGGPTVPIDVTWAGLTPGFEYDLYVFALENFQGTFDQRVTITGDGTPITFNQVTSNGVLMINDEAGSNARTLESYAERVTATEFGTIRVRVEANAGSDGIVIPGLAISEVIPATTIASINASNLTQSEGDSGTTSFSFTVTRSGDVSSSATVNYAVTPRDGNPVNAADFGGSFPSGQVQFQAGQTTSQVVTFNVSGDSVAEADERFTVTLSGPSDGARLAVTSAIGTISNDDGSLGSGSITLDTIGLYQPDAPLFHLRNALSSGGSDQFFAFGPGGNAGWIPLSGDWNGDGTDTIGLYQPDISLFHLKDSFTPGASDQYFAFGPGGNAGWIPLAGDWNGDGTDTIGLYQPDISLFHLKDTFTSGASDQYFAFGPGGNAGWIPLAGDWNGDGTDTIGLYQPDISLFHLKDTFTSGASDQYFGFGPGGNAGWLPMVGDWNGDGTDTIGLYEPAVSRFHLKDSFTAGASDYFFIFGPGGNAGWTPISGDWNGPSSPPPPPPPPTSNGSSSGSGGQAQRAEVADNSETGDEFTVSLLVAHSPQARSATPSAEIADTDAPAGSNNRDRSVTLMTDTITDHAIGGNESLRLLDEVFGSW